MEAAREGKAVERVYLNDGHRLLDGQKPGQVAIVTIDNVDEYEPESP